MKNRIILILSIFIFICFIFINTNVFATETDSLIVDGYDMSDVYNYFSKEDAFFIVDWAGQGSEYYIYVPSPAGYTAYCAISSTTSCIYYNMLWEGLDTPSYQFYKFNFDTLKFEKAWYGHPNDWTLDNNSLVFAYASRGIYNQDHSTYYYEPSITTNDQPNDDSQDSMDVVSNILKDTQETNKNIFKTITDILSYLNPFSENFFAYKLVELLLDGLKGLFVPADNFFSDWLEDINNYFGDTFGILYYPFELLVDFLNRIGNIQETNSAIISVPSFKLEFMGYSVVFFEDISYDLNTILENNIFRTIHDIYLIFTDIILWLGLVYLAAKMLHSVLGGMGDEVQQNIYDSQAEERSYARYKQYRANRIRYNLEHKRR